jgi:hypothetical protein
LSGPGSDEHGVVVGVCVREFGLVGNKQFPLGADRHVVLVGVDGELGLEMSDRAVRTDGGIPDLLSAIDAVPAEVNYADFADGQRRPVAPIGFERDRLRPRHAVEPPVFDAVPHAREVERLAALHEPRGIAGRDIQRVQALPAFLPRVIPQVVTDSVLERRRH